MVNKSQLPYLIQLLDDESKETQLALKEEFAHYNGDVSQEISEMGIHVSKQDSKYLQRFLHPSKQKNIMKKWVVPKNLDDDWDSFEYLLNLIFDYIHDGFSLRPSLEEGLASLEAEMLEKYKRPTVNKLRKFLFTKRYFFGAKSNYYAIENSDIRSTFVTHKGNPVTLCILFILMAHRLDLAVTACNYPGHFLACINIRGERFLVDCFNEGHLIPVETLLKLEPKISIHAERSLQTNSTPREIIIRILNNIEYNFKLNNKKDDVRLIQKLLRSLSF